MLKHESSYMRSAANSFTFLQLMRCALAVLLALLLAATSFLATSPTAYANEAEEAAENEATVFNDPALDPFDDPALDEFDDLDEFDEGSEPEGIDTDEECAPLADDESTSGLAAQNTKLETLAADTVFVRTTSEFRNAVQGAPKNTQRTIVLTANIFIGGTDLYIYSDKNITLASGHAAGAAPFTLNASGGDISCAVYVRYGAVFTLDGIAITCSKGYGVRNMGTFIMNSGKIEKCKTGVSNVGSFTLAGGTISSCKESGIVNISFSSPAPLSGVFTMTGGTITNNSAKQGAGVYNTSTFTMTGGVIENNSAKENGGGVLSGNKWGFRGGAFKMTGGRIANNTAQGNGGGVCNEGEDCETTQYGGTFKMTGGSIENNTAKKEGGGIYTYAYNKLTVGEKAEFSGNKAKGSYNRLSKSNKVYKSKIACKKWTAPFTQGYNNYDINYTGHAGLYTLAISGKTLGIEKSSKKIKKPTELQKKEYTATQRFNIKRVETNGTKDYYTITNVLSGKRLAVKGGKATKGAVIWQTKASKSKAQRFSFEKNPQGGYWISPKGSKLVFSLKSGKTD
ncbi:MAG: RICIN domain-containing protein, partial [Coriobacteriales bacterium]|nr:RICIN domain-containing protein [Coriobacteriales bacterium]